MKAIKAGLLQTTNQTLVAEFQPEQIWLFGSHACGKPHDGSDVARFVVVRDSSETPIRRAQRVRVGFEAAKF